MIRQVEYEYIDIDKSIIPYDFDILLKGETYKMEINYNEVEDFFTVNLSKDENVLIQNDKIVYGRPLFSQVNYKPVPKVLVVPFDTSNRHNRVTFENLNKDVFLYLMEEGDYDRVLGSES